MHPTNKNIAFIITSTGWGGLEMNTMKLLKIFSEKGYQISLITTNEATIAQKSVPYIAQSYTIYNHRKYFDFSNSKKIARFLKAHSISKIFVLDTKDLDVVSWTKRLYYNNLNIIYQQHMQLGINKKNLFQTFRFKSIDTWISPLNYLKEEVCLRTKFPKERIQVIPIGIDSDALLAKQYTKHMALKALNIQPIHPLIGIIGRISKKKGQLKVIQMAHQLLQDGIELEVLIFGSPTINDSSSQEYLKQIHSYISKHELNKYIHFVPHNEDIHQFYNAIDLFVLASSSETYGMVTLEAMLFELPIVATNSGGTSEILGDGKYGNLFPSEDVNKGAEAIKNALTHSSIMKEKAKQAKENVLQHYTLSHEISSFERIINS